MPPNYLSPLGADPGVSPSGSNLPGVGVGVGVGGGGGGLISGSSPAYIPGIGIGSVSGAGTPGSFSFPFAPGSNTPGAGAGAGASASMGMGMGMGVGGRVGTPGMYGATPLALSRTPGAGPNTGPGMGQGHGQGQGYPAGGAGAGVGESSSGISLDAALRGTDEALGLVQQLELALGRLDEAQRGVFSPGSDGSGTEAEAETGTQGIGPLGRLQGAYLEYTRLVSLLQLHLSTSTLGALPLHPTPTTATRTSNAPNAGLGDPAIPADPSAPTPAPMSMSMPELTAWAEQRAALEFSRREGARAGGKIVLDALKAR